MKVIPLTGNLSELKYRPINQEFQSKSWYIKLCSVAFESQVEFQNTLIISCNFVTSEMYSKSGTILTYQQPLQMFFVKLAPRYMKIFRCFT